MVRQRGEGHSNPFLVAGRLRGTEDKNIVADTNVRSERAHHDVTWLVRGETESSGTADLSIGPRSRVRGSPPMVPEVRLFVFREFSCGDHKGLELPLVVQHCLSAPESKKQQTGRMKYLLRITGSAAAASGRDAGTFPSAGKLGPATTPLQTLSHIIYEESQCV